MTGTIRAVIGVLILMVVIAFGLQLRSCTMARQQAAQSKVDRGQGAAGRESAGDSLNVQGEVSTRAAESEALTKSNSEEIRNAKGADQVVDPGVAAAGRNSLCRRAAYRQRPECRVQQPNPS